MSPPGKRVLIITRPEEDFAAAAAEFPGHDCLCAPCLAFEPVAPGEVAGLRGRIQDGAVLLVTSPRAVAGLAALVAGGEGGRRGWRVAALLPRTAREAAAALAGSGVEAEGWEGGAAGLAAAATARWPGAPLCLLTSQLGGEEVWRVRPDASRLVVYRTVCPARLPEGVARALAGGGYELLVASPSAAEHLERLWPGALAGAARLHLRGRTTELAVAGILGRG